MKDLNPNLTRDPQFDSDHAAQRLSSPGAEGHPVERMVKYLLGADRIASCQRSCISNPIGEDDPGVVSSAEG